LGHLNIREAKNGANNSTLRIGRNDYNFAFQNPKQMQ